MAKSIMIQGTTSGAGKTLIAAGLCRILHRKGYRVAPFKSQNMALNSYITADGLEMSRAQAIQAQCAGIRPDVRMNPVLLKPSSDTGSQVILNGKPVGHMAAAEYYAWKKNAIPSIRESYESLAEEYDVIVLEGAGSPAEINLKHEDIVNMGMAKMAGAPVLLVGDINPGGVFASLAGTYQLLQPWERAHIRGIVINKFRGDAKILEPGLAMLEGIINKPVLGVVPYMDLDIDDEDGLTGHSTSSKMGALVDVAVIRLPRMSNVTDFSPLAVMDEVCVRYVDAPQKMGNPDLMIIPGTSSVEKDLLWMRENGIEAHVLAHASAGNPVLGISGGFQILGESLVNTQSGDVLSGLGLLPVQTRLGSGETTKGQVTGHLGEFTGVFAPLSKEVFSGYTIFQGETAIPDLPPFSFVHQGDGSAVEEGVFAHTVYGTHIHELFHAPGIARLLVQSLLAAKGLDGQDVQAVRTVAYREQQYDILADGLEAALDMERIMSIVEGK